MAPLVEASWGQRLMMRSAWAVLDSPHHLLLLLSLLLSLLSSLFPRYQEPLPAAARDHVRYSQKSAQITRNILLTTFTFIDHERGTINFPLGNTYFYVQYFTLC